MSVLKMYRRFIKVSGLYGIAAPYPAILYRRGDLRNTLCLTGHADRQKPPEMSRIMKKCREVME